jgi:hypothetical protein
VKQLRRGRKINGNERNKKVTTKGKRRVNKGRVEGTKEKHGNICHTNIIIKLWCIELYKCYRFRGPGEHRGFRKQ